jgi:cell division protein FtsQ
LAERRRNLLAVDWVKDATVSRVWPNQIAVRVEERRPVAFLKQNADAVAMMIDEEGVVLRLQDTARYKLPVVAGIREADPPSGRRLQIRRMLRLQTEIGPHHFERLSEIDLADPENIKVTYPLTDRALVLYMGHGSYARRLRNFLENLNTVLERYPTARTLDLRLDDRILVPGAVPAKTGEPRAE